MVLDPSNLAQKAGLLLFLKCNSWTSHRLQCLCYVYVYSTCCYDASVFHLFKGVVARVARSGVRYRGLGYDTQ